MPSPRCLKTMKGALILLHRTHDPTPTIFIFQYNPDLITSTFSYQDPYAPITGKPPQGQTTPSEIINLTVELDATDDLENPERNEFIREKGLHPHLATLEKIFHDQQQTTQTREPPTLIFHWGQNRILPVHLTSMRIIEEAFDPKLNPVRTKIELNLMLMQPAELKKGSKAYQIYRDYLAQRNAFAALYRGTQESSDFSAYSNVF